MNAQVTIRFSPTVTLEYSVPYTSDATAQAQARDWLERTYSDFGCEPARPIGKVLLLDKILGIADAAGAHHFERHADWAKEFAQAVSSALDRTAVEVDVAGRTVSS
ncbi:MAG: hypothetical protein U1F48_10200 [Burkholderiales bacterium]